MNYSCDFLIAGGGAVGLTIAHQLLERNISNKIIVLDKEDELGLHSSGRNSGVIHAGIYYSKSPNKEFLGIDIAWQDGYGFVGAKSLIIILCEW